jgi:hypothetical protein
VEVRIEVEPARPVRLLGGGGAASAGLVLERLLHIEGDPVVVRVADGGRSFMPARARRGAGAGIERMRFALGVDDDLRDFTTASRGTR